LQLDPVLREAVNLLKFQGKIILAKPLADMMIKALPELLNMEDYDLIVPVPLYKQAQD